LWERADIDRPNQPCWRPGAPLRFTLDRYLQAAGDGMGWSQTLGLPAPHVYDGTGKNTATQVRSWIFAVVRILQIVVCLQPTARGYMRRRRSGIWISCGRNLVVRSALKRLTLFLTLQPECAWIRRYVKSLAPGRIIADASHRCGPFFSKTRYKGGMVIWAQLHFESRGWPRPTLSRT
jgi:hypothetical protein